MADRSKLRLAVWGIGYHAEKNVLPTLAECESITLVGVCSRDHERAGRAVEGMGATVWAAPEPMLASDEIDAVYLCTPTGLHYEQGVAVIRAGKHLLCEKALTGRASHSLALIAEARRKNRALCEAFMYSFHPQFQRLADVIDEPAFGQVEALSCWFGMPTLDNPGFRHSRALGGGGFLDLACYPISLAARLIEGQPRVEAAAVRMGDDVEVDTAGHATLRFPAGAVAQLGWGFGRAYCNEVNVWGKKKSVYADRIFSKPPTFVSQLLVRNERGDRKSIEIPAANAFVGMLDAFAEAAQNPGERERLWDIATRQARIVAGVEEVIAEQLGWYDEAHAG